MVPPTNGTPPESGLSFDDMDPKIQKSVQKAMKEIQEAKALAKNWASFAVHKIFRKPGDAHEFIVEFEFDSQKGKFIVVDADLLSWSKCKDAILHTSNRIIPIDFKDELWQAKIYKIEIEDAPEMITGSHSRKMAKHLIIEILSGRPKVDKLCNVTENSVCFDTDSIFFKWSCLTKGFKGRQINITSEELKFCLDELQGQAVEKNYGNFWKLPIALLLVKEPEDAKNTEPPEEEKAEAETF